MELAGNEKRIRALFRELKAADERVAPEFNRVWSRAQSTHQGSPRVFKISLALATALFVITLSSLVLWSQNWQRSQQPNPGIATGPAAPGSTPAPQSRTPKPALPGVVAQSNSIKFKRRDLKVTPRRNAEPNARNAAIREAVSISSWQSPTAALMQSPADRVLTSLPQLDQSLTNLKTFLPNTPQ
jgi:hypothetical protein